MLAVTDSSGNLVTGIQYFLKIFLSSKKVFYQLILYISDSSGNVVTQSVLPVTDSTGNLVTGNQYFLIVFFNIGLLAIDCLHIRFKW